MRLVRTDSRGVSALREERRRGVSLGIVPVFYSRLAGEADAHLIEETAEAGDTDLVLGYVLTLERPHDGHSHVTTIEFHLSDAYRHRHEDALDLIRDELRPTAHLARTDDCLYNAALLSRGLQVEPTALVMLWTRPSTSIRTVAETGGAGAAAVALAEFGSAHMAEVDGLLDERKDGELAGDLKAMADSGHAWAVLEGDHGHQPVARRDGGDGSHELLDFALARASEASLSEALVQAASRVADTGLRPAAVIDASEATRRRIFRQAGFHTAASYMVYYDPVAGRPSVGVISTEDLHSLLESGEPVRVVDVLGEAHWKEGHIPGSEWIDFKGLARESRKRFGTDEPIVVYCSGFT